MSAAWTVEIHKEIAAPAAEVIDNYLDFDHAEVLHDGGYAYTRLLHSAGNAHFLEYGVKLFCFPIKTVGWFQFVPPGRFVSHSKALFGTTDILVVTDVREAGDATSIDVVYTIRPPALFRPLRRVIERRLRRWNATVWEEDKALLLRRAKLLKMGFRDNVGLPEAQPSSRAG
jgi:hypothetical protein